MSKPIQLLPATPRLADQKLFDCGFAVCYEEWNSKKKRYEQKTADFGTIEDAEKLIEYLKCQQILEPIQRFIDSEEHKLCVLEIGNQWRIKHVSQILKDIKYLLEPAGQTCSRIAEYFYNGGGDLFKKAMPGKKSKYYPKADALLTEIRLFTRLHLATKAVAA